MVKTSVALVTYNSEKYLRPQVDTILENLGPNDEVVVSDDGSTDSTMHLASSLRSPLKATIRLILI